MSELTDKIAVLKSQTWLGDGSYAIADTYLERTYELVRSMVIKSDDVAILGEKPSMVYTGNFNMEEDKETWRYYCHLAGEYHTSDTHMVVTSLDTLTDMVLTTENLLTNTATKKELLKGTEYYQKVVCQYPEQKNLLHGMLNPISKEISIPASTGTILYHDNTLIELNEMTLEHDLQQWVYDYHHRWYNPALVHSDELYVSAHVAILALKMVERILILREDRRHTHEAHSFHVGQYLSSYGISRTASANLTLRQRLYLYDNLRYINKHPGHRDVFEQMTEELVFNIGLPLDGYTHELIHSDGVIVPAFKKIEYGVRSGITTTTKDYTAYKTIENTILTNNEDIDTDKVLQTISSANITTVKTKLLESNTIDISSSESYSEISVLFNHWAYLAAVGSYDTYIRIDDINTGNKVTLSITEAFSLLMILSNKILGNGIDIVPRSMQIHGVQQTQNVSLADHIHLGLNAEDIATINSNLVTFKTYNSVDSFYTDVLGVFSGHAALTTYIASIDDPYRRANVKQVVASCYTSTTITPDGSGDPISTWYARKQLTPLTSLSDAIDLFNTILYKATGYLDETRYNASKVQESCMSILERYSSYNVEFSYNINENPVVLMDTQFDQILGSTETDITDVISATLTGLSIFSYDYPSTAGLLDIGDLASASDARLQQLL